MEMRFTTLGPTVHVGIDLVEDRENHTFHLFDLDVGTTLTNAISEELQKRILERLGYTDAISDWKWFLYHTDGVATEYKGGFHHVSLDDPRLYESFVEALKVRK